MIVKELVEELENLATTAVRDIGIIVEDGIHRWDEPRYLEYLSLAIAKHLVRRVTSVMRRRGYFEHQIDTFFSGLQTAIRKAKEEAIRSPKGFGGRSA